MRIPEILETFKSLSDVSDGGVAIDSIQPKQTSLSRSLSNDLLETA